jgi:hypothetical protein
MPTPAFAHLTWTEAGIAAIQWVDPIAWTETYALVWAIPRAPGDLAFAQIGPDAILPFPILAPLESPTPGARPMRIQTPVGFREIAWPRDAAGDVGGTGDVSVTRDGAFLVYHARALSADSTRELYDQVVAVSTTTGAQTVLANEPGWNPQVASDQVAYVTFPDPGNQVCVKEVRLVS